MKKISPEDEKAIWEAYFKSKSAEDRNKLIEIYAGLVHYIAGKIAMYKPTNIAYDDLVNEGVLGLINAIDKFKPEMGIKFTTYAVTRVRGFILDKLRKYDWVPRNLREKSRKIDKAITELESRFGRHPTEEEIADYLNISIDKYRDLVYDLSVMKQLSLEEKRGSNDDESISLVDAIEAPDGDNPEFILAKKELKTLLADAIMKLPEKEKYVLALYYYDDLTLKEIGVALDITESRACQLHKEAISRLKTYLKGTL